MRTLFPGYNTLMRNRLISLTALAAGTYLGATIAARLRVKRFGERVVIISGGSRGLGLTIASSSRDYNELS